MRKGVLVRFAKVCVIIIRSFVDVYIQYGVYGQVIIVGVMVIQYHTAQSMGLF